MDIISAIAVTALVFFVLGVLFHRYVVSEANSIKTHTSNEFSALRADLVNFMQKVSSKL